MPIKPSNLLIATLCLVALTVRAAAQTPGAPTGLTATVNADLTLSLQWTASSTGGAPTGYLVQIGTAPGGTDVLNQQIGNVTSYQTSALAGGTYYVRVRALNGTGISAASNEVTVTITCQAPPTGATNFSWRPLATNRVQLVWTAASDLTWTVEVGSAPGLADVFTGPAEFQLKRTITLTLAPGTYYARVRGVNACGAEAPASSELIVVSGEATGSSQILINEFDGFVELKNAGTTALDIAGWRLLTAVGFDKRVTSAAALPIGTTIAAGCTYLLAPSSTVLGVPVDLLMGAFGRSYALVDPSGRIVDSVARRDLNMDDPTTPFGEGPQLPDLITGSFARINDQDTNNNVADFTNLTTPTPANAAACSLLQTPGAPTNLTVAVSGNAVTLSWSAPTTGGVPTHYRLEAGTSAGASNAGVFDLGISPTAVSFGSVANGTYYVRMRAANRAGLSAASNEVTVVVCGIGCTLPPGPVSQLAFQVSGRNVLLTWRGPTSGAAPTGYVIEAGRAAGLTDIGQFPTGSPSEFVIVTAVPPGTYFVRVRAASGGALGQPSNEVVIVVP